MEYDDPGIGDYPEVDNRYLWHNYTGWPFSPLLQCQRRPPPTLGHRINATAPMLPPLTCMS